MSAVLTVLTAMTGGTLVLWGWARYLRHRFSRRTRSVAGRRSGVAIAALGALLSLLPDLPARLVLDTGPAAGGVTGALDTVAMLVWRLAVLVGLGVVFGSMLLTRERVTAPLRAMADRGVATVVSVVPFGAPGHARALRRQPGLADFPRDWESVLERDAGLTRRLLDYERDLDRAADLPAMRDHSVPATAQAWRAMQRCDDLRPRAPIGRAGDVLLTDYGRAVAQFEAAVRGAEANALRLAQGNVTDAEREAIAAAQRTLAFLERSHTTPAERAAVYEELAARLAGARPSPRPGDPERSHPWLDVPDRASG